MQEASILLLEDLYRCGRRNSKELEEQLHSLELLRNDALKPILP